MHILSQAGTVVKFRLMTNPDTGKPKGFGFADYTDDDSAASAVRNLNDYEIQGRKIRVDWPHNNADNEKDSAPDANTAPLGGINGQPTSALPPLPPGIDLPANLKATDKISQTLSTLPPSQLLDVLQQMKQLATSDPQKTIDLLKTSPQLSYALFQALILMNLVDPKVLGQVIEQAARPPPPIQVPQQHQQQHQPPTVPPPHTAPPFGQFPPPIPPPSRGPQPTPQQQAQYAPPPQPIPQQQQPPLPPPMQQQGAPMSQDELIRQVLAMDQRTIDSLPMQERQQIIQLRAQLGVR